MSDAMILVPGGPSCPQVDPARAVTDTGELRWFAPGLTPSAVLTWFGGSAVEQRCDTYLLDRRHDVGLKLRSGKTLELKVRQSVDGATLALSEGLAGRLERWRRWSPADGLVDFDANAHPWVDVEKTIVKRRFLDTGDEVAVDPVLPSTDFCDIELASLTVDGTRWWSLALAAYGAVATGPTVMRAAWGAVAAAPPPPALRAALGEQNGYPAWLADSVLPGSHASPAAVAAAS